MNILGNIITETNINIGKEFNIVKSIEDINNNLPTLIVGYKNVVDYYTLDNINVLSRNITDDIFWTFKRTSDRKIYSSDLEDFIRYCYKKYVKEIKIINLDVFQYPKKLIINIVKKILSIKDVIAYESEIGVIYIYFEKMIFIVDLRQIEYLGIDGDKIRNRIKDRSIKYFIGNDTLSEYAHNIERLDNEIRYLPFLIHNNSTE